jgi:hypothetical protein
MLIEPVFLGIFSFLIGSIRAYAGHVFPDNAAAFQHGQGKASRSFIYTCFGYFSLPLYPFGNIMQTADWFTGEP